MNLNGPNNGDQVPQWMADYINQQAALAEQWEQHHEAALQAQKQRFNKVLGRQYAFFEEQLQALNTLAISTLITVLAQCSKQKLGEVNFYIDKNRNLYPAF